MPEARPTATSGDKAPESPLERGYKDFGKLVAALAIAVAVGMALWGIVKAVIIVGPQVGPPALHYLLDLVGALQWRVFLLAALTPIVASVGILAYTSLRYGPVVGDDTARFMRNTLAWAGFGSLVVGFVWSIVHEYLERRQSAFPVIFGLLVVCFGIIILVIQLMERAAKRREE